MGRRKEKKEEMKRIREEGEEEEEKGNEYLTSHMTDDDITVWMPVPWLHDRCHAESLFMGGSRQRGYTSITIHSWSSAIGSLLTNAP